MDVIWYRQWIKNVAADSSITTVEDITEAFGELLNYIEHLEGIVDRAAGEIDCIGYPGAREALNAARENEERRRKAQT